MTQNIFHVLPRLIGNIREKAECCDIYKYILIKGSHITGKIIPLYNRFRGMHHIFRQSQTASEIIGTSCRDISNRCPEATADHTRDYFVQSTVSTAADNNIIVLAPIPGLLHGIFTFLRGINGNLIITLGKHIQNIRKLVADLCLSGFRIIDK